MKRIRLGGCLLTAALLAGAVATPAAATPAPAQSSSARAVMNGPNVQDPTGTFRFSADSATVDNGTTLELSLTYTNKSPQAALAAEFAYIGTPPGAFLINPLCTGPDNVPPDLCSGLGVEAGTTFVGVPAGDDRAVGWTVTVPATTPAGTTLTFTPLLATDLRLLGLTAYSVPPLVITVV
ncbi:hypothetical protein NGM36_27635 [Streptomyces mutabilis]|uniref:hypothetical protein n=1 Tax=Streptomyces mutabilis TaxID=67332 RepID=UPI0022BA1879|nr:hypothetical protein [Streptomyces mutabilis]MCZ9353494.1 hypothetical protein [Streptomyces mutabilis]